ncbi:hypothetical protein J3458_008721 [Metarhizium acridum]|uniref:uncharacterized protein n=1 Tax=Metarhizium acridum TaxID=92637 RepID=UPI001C6B0B7C|nr:hypothetical protein J3458_008721 [Metarhizium acridum]
MVQVPISHTNTPFSTSKGLARQRQGFYINFPVGGLAALVISLVAIPDRRIRIPGGAWAIVRHKFDLPGFALFAPLRNHGLARSRIRRQCIPTQLGHGHRPADGRRGHPWCVLVLGEAGGRRCHDAADHYPQAGDLDGVPDHGFPVCCLVRSELLPADLLPEHKGRESVPERAVHPAEYFDAARVCRGFWFSGSVFPIDSAFLRAA